MSTKNSKINLKEYSVQGKIITFSEPKIMAIVNVTPDSFYDGGKYSSYHDVLKDVEEKVNQGAHIIDLGAASTRPNAEEISIETEWERLSSILPAVRKTFPHILISIDSYRAQIAERAVNEGADIINDIGGGDLDTNMFATVARLQVPYILMHIQGTPQTMQKDPKYLDVVKEVKSSLEKKINRLTELGFSNIIIDPGFGFGKNLNHNYRLLKNLDELSTLDKPILAGVSRKGMINKVIGTSPVTSLNGTTVLNTIALLNGASILRVHDVNEARQAIELVQFYKNA